MRNPSKRTHIRLGIGQRNAPRPATDEILRTRLGYVVLNHVRQGSFQTARGLAARHAYEAAAQSSRASTPRRIRANKVIATEQFSAVSNGRGRTREAAGLRGKRIAAGFTDVVSAALPGDAPLLLAQLQVQELVAANRRKDEFLAFLSHELRNPLCAIGYAVGLLRSHTIDGSPQQPLQAGIERQLLRMTQLVDEVLDVSRITNGLLHLHSEPLDLRVVVVNAIETLQSDIKGRNQRLNTRLPEGPVWVMGDERRLEQVVVNLIANASRYTDKGGKLTAWMDIEGGEAVICIRDSGIGMAPDSLPHIFELFRQANQADPRSRAGLGVGLALVRQLVELHGGKVTAASEGIGRGSEFKVSLPIHAQWLPATVEMRLGGAEGVLDHKLNGLSPREGCRS
jgi:signal transduction histidine kinase